MKYEVSLLVKVQVHDETKGSARMLAHDCIRNLIDTGPFKFITEPTIKILKTEEIQ